MNRLHTAAALFTTEPLTPPAASSSPPNFTIDSLRDMSGRARRDILRSHGVPQSHLLLYLRAIQHLLTLPDTKLVPQYDTAEMFPSADELASFPSAVHWGNTLTQSTVHRQNTEPPGYPPLPPPLPPSQAPFVGLKNQGSTCYANSVLQSLFHLSAFREGIYHIHFSSLGEVGCAIPHALQQVFYELQCGSEAATTHVLTKAFGWSSGEAFVQHDVHEFLQLILETLENQMKVERVRNVVQELFVGEIENYIEIPEIKFHKAVVEPFNDLRLTVKGHADIYSSLHQLSQQEHLDGDNKYCLEAEDGTKKYHRATKGLRIKRLPPVLVLHLARFDYDAEQGQMKKVLSRWDYYEDIDMSTVVKASSTEETSFTLHSVLVHCGADTRHGHYYSYTKSSDGIWYEFNDETVTTATRRSVFGRNFGGARLSYSGTDCMLYSNAYMLVYVQKSKWGELVHPTVEVPPHLQQRILEEQQRAMLEEEQRLQRATHASVMFISTEELIQNSNFVQFGLTPQFDVGCITLPKNGPALPLIEKAYCSGKEEAASVPPLFFFVPQMLEGTLQLSRRVNEDDTIQSLLVQELPHLIVLVCAVVSPPTIHSDEAIVTHHFLYEPRVLRHRYITAVVTKAGASLVTLRNNVLVSKGVNPGASSVEQFGTKCAGATVVRDGGQYMWYHIDDGADVLYPNIDDYYSFLSNRISVHFHVLEPPTYPLRHVAELADDMTYEMLQRYLSEVLEINYFDHVRFASHNPETLCPNYSRPKKRDNPNLRLLLQGRRGKAMMQPILYFELSNYTVSEIEAGNLINFEVFDRHVKFVSRHQLLMPLPPLDVREVLTKCAQEAMIEESASELQLLDVWKGKICFVFRDGSAHINERFQEHADYRLEPLLLPSSPADILVRISHFYRSKAKVICHGDPFLLYCSPQATYEQFLEIVSRVLDMPLQTLRVWRGHLVQEQHCVKLDETRSIGFQMEDFATLEAFATAASVDLQNSPHLGFEHAALPTTRRVVRLTEQGLRIRK